MSTFLSPHFLPKGGRQCFLAHALTGCFALGLLVPMAEAALIFEEDFETVSTGWGIGTKTHMGTVTGEVSFASPGSATTAFPTRSLRVSHVTGNSQRVVSQAASLFNIERSSTLTHTFTFEARASRTNVAGYVTFLDSTNGSQLPVLVEFRNDNTIRTGFWDETISATNKNNNNFTLLSGYQADTTYTFTITTTPSTGLFSLSVSGGTASLEDKPFRQTVAGLSPFTGFNTIAIYNDGGVAGGSAYDLYVDNLRVTAIPEPASGLLTGVALAGLAFFSRRTRA